jgi:hypothetical protein
MKKTKITALFAAIIFIASCGGKKEESNEEKKTDSIVKTPETAEIPIGEPVEYVSEGGKYKINYKAKPKEEEPKAVEGNIDMYITMLEQGTIVYMTAYADFPPDKLKKAKTKELLDASKGGIVEKFQATITDEKWSKFQGFESVDFTASGPQFSTSYKLILADNRLYQIGILQTGGPVSQAETDGFIGTFEIMGDKPAQ